MTIGAFNDVQGLRRGPNKLRQEGSFVWTPHDNGFIVSGGLARQISIFYGIQSFESTDALVSILCRASLSITCHTHSSLVQQRRRLG